MKNWTSERIRVGGVELYYTRTGGAKPALVLAHGFSDDGLCWTRFAQGLIADYDIIMYDARGHGRSQRIDHALSTAEMAVDAIHLIEALGLRRPAMMGHSMGAAVTAWVAAERPDLVRCAVLEDPPWFDADSLRRRGSRQSHSEESRPETRDELIARCKVQSPTWHEDEVGPWADSKIRFDPKPWDLSRIASAAWQDVASRITVPTLLLTANPDKGAIVTDEIAQEALGLIKAGERVHSMVAGHCIHREDFDAVLGAVRSFLARWQD